MEFKITSGPFGQSTEFKNASPEAILAILRGLQEDAIVTIKDSAPEILAKEGDVIPGNTPVDEWPTNVKVATDHSAWMPFFLVRRTEDGGRESTWASSADGAHADWSSFWSPGFSVTVLEVE